MFTEKERVLSEAQLRLNNDANPWSVSIEGDSIVARWKWMDARFYSLEDVTNEVKEYFFSVTLNDKGKWKEKEFKKEKKANIDFATGTFSLGSSTNSGKMFQKTIEIGVGKDNQTGKTGILVYKFDTEILKKPIRQYLIDCGWKKSGLFF